MNEAFNNENYKAEHKKLMARLEKLQKKKSKCEWSGYLIMTALYRYIRIIKEIEGKEDV